ncbi:hypothetical protein MOV08_00555 [Streptomyces yunnanensis]|uniref:Uncharacterized protein n=1 Tax=Streptomyces yunnanensis TaxID=156453 RepID=A0ABY8A0Y8_9ACTN|nr:hypothetical protein [Streptomyces yunnanensis]WEB37956.1 hypothetical protein MOV08_00555 [Streptomyces yunnanensis]
MSSGRAALGSASSPAEVDQVLPSGADRVEGIVEPLVSWLRMWGWSPALSALLLIGLRPAARRGVLPVAGRVG